MYRSLAVLGAAINLISDASAIALPAPSSAAAASNSPSQNAVSVLCSALSGTSLPAACLSTPSSTAPPQSSSPVALGCSGTSGSSTGLCFETPIASTTASITAPSSSQSQNALSVLCSALSGSSTPAACLPTPLTTSPITTSTTSTSSTTSSTSSTVSVPSACASGTIPNDGSASCWGDLDLSTYVNDWWNANQGSCGNTASSGSASSFANCWYKLNVPSESPAECDVLATGTNCAKPSWDTFTGDNAVQNFWVSWSIYNVNQFWTEMNAAITAAGSAVEGIVGKVVTTLNPPTPPSTPAWEYVLDALTFATSLWAEGSVITKAIVRSIPQTSTLITKVYPQGQVEGTVIEWSDAEYQISQFITSWASSIGEAVPLVANDVTSFVNMASVGQFTGGVFDLTGLTNSIHLVLGTYMTSVSAVATDYIITRTAGQSIAQVQSTDQLQWDTGCDNGYTDGICGAFYYDGTDTYSLQSLQKWQIDPTPLFQLFVGDAPIADPSLLFTGSLACSTSNNNNNGGAKPTLDQNDPTQFSCIASNRVCTWNWDLNSNLDSFPFLPNCGPNDASGAFLFNCGTGVYDNFGKCVPFSYFGPSLETSDGTKLCHTNCGGGNVG